jgi:hypothetical protein
MIIKRRADGAASQRFSPRWRWTIDKKASLVGNSDPYRQLERIARYKSGFRPALGIESLIGVSPGGKGRGVLRRHVPGSTVRESATPCGVGGIFLPLE